MDADDRTEPLSPMTKHARSSIWREGAMCGTIYAAQLFTQASLGNTILPLHIIAEDFGAAHGSAGSQLPWCVAAYSLTVGAFMLVTGRLGDVYGHKRVYVYGMVWYGIISLLLGFSAYTKHIEIFIVLRALQGIGPACCLPNGVALLAHAYPENGFRKALVFALFGAAAPLGFVTGAGVSSFFAQVAYWPWAQWILGVLCLIVAAVGSSDIIPPTLVRMDTQDSVSRVDWIGASTSVLGLVAIVFACNQGPIDGWETWYVPFAMIGGVILLAIFAWVESRAPYPIMPLDIWTQPGFPGVIICMMLGWASFGVWNFYTVQLMENQRQTSPLMASAQLSPLFPFGLLATMIMWQLHHRVKGQYVLTAAMVAFCIGNLLIALCPVDSSYWTYLFAAMMITPFGMDLSYPSASLIVSNSLPPERQGVGASMINTAVNVSISIGLGIAATVERYVEERNGPKDTSERTAASYCGVAMAGAGILVALIFCRVPDSKHNVVEVTSHIQGDSKSYRSSADDSTELSINARCEF